MARMPVPDRRGFDQARMPSLGRMAYYPAFPPAVRPSGVGCIRVTHPSATLMPPKGHLPYDLHVLGLPLAFILSQDQTLRCTIVFAFCSTLNLGFRLLVHPCTAVFLTRFLFSASLRMPVLASDFQRTSCSRFPSSLPLVPSESGCKSTAFSVTRKHFFRKNFTLFVTRYISI